MINKLKNLLLLITTAVLSILYILRIKKQRDDATEKMEKAEALAVETEKVVKKKEQYYQEVLENEKQPAYPKSTSDNDNDTHIRL